MTKNKLITTTKHLEAFLSEIAESPFITVDTEFMRERTYYPELCLIQVGDEHGHAAAIDPLADNIDLTPFFNFLDNPDQVKVLHAARQDLEIFYYLVGRLPQNLYDTQIAASFLGLGEQVAYKTLVQKYCGADMSKAQQFTDWSRRPLKDDQIEYALSDVTYLAEIYKAISAELEQKNRTSWIKDELALMTDTGLYDIDPETAWERVKIRSHKGKDLMVLKRLSAWREEEAKKRNVPKGRILKDEAMAQIAMIQPRDEKALSEIRFFGQGRTKSSDARIILGLVKDAVSTPKTQWPQKEKRKHLAPEKAAALEMLKMLIRVIAAEHEISARMLASNDDLEELARLGKNARIPALKGWRYDIFGREALDLIEGRLALSFQDNTITRHLLD